VKTIDAKQQILDDADFTYNFDRQIYVNRKMKKIFSLEFVQDHDEHELDRCVHESTTGKEWRFYFNDVLPPAVRREIEALLG
jgi:hypothetical protein